MSRDAVADLPRQVQTLAIVLATLLVALIISNLSSGEKTIDYEIAVPPGTYTVEVESVFGAFVAGSGVGPLDPPITIPGVPEFWNQDESAFDYPLQRDTITVHPGDNIPSIDIILNSPYQRFDQYEDSGQLRVVPTASPLQSMQEILV